MCLYFKRMSSSSSSVPATTETPLIGYYINLDRRQDRRLLFEQEIKVYPLFSQLQRFPAISNANGSIGCTLSHCQALIKLQEHALDAHAAYVAVFEDDFCVLNKTHLAYFFQAFQRIRDLPEWDILTLTPRGDTHHQQNLKNNDFLRIVNTQTMTGYIVKTSVLPTLVQNLKEACVRLLLGQSIATSICDQYWKRLQSTTRFYYYKHIFAGQRPGWSDLEKSHVNYNDRFLTQNKY